MQQFATYAPLLGICQWFHYDDRRLDSVVTWLRHLDVKRLRTVAPIIVAVGPHASTTPAATLRTLAADAVVIGECEDVLPLLDSPRDRWTELASVGQLQDGRPAINWPLHVFD